MAYFDGPAGTQVPDSVLEAVSGYLLTANANAGGKFVTSMVTDDVIGSARAAAGRPARSRNRRGHLRRQHDLAQLRPLAHGRARMEEGRRDRRHAARPRREHLALARARLRQAADRPFLRDRQRVPDRPRPPALARERAHEGRRVPDGLERRRHDHAREGDHRDRARGGSARLGRCRALRAARRHRDRRARLRRPALLAVQVLRAAPRARLGAARSLGELAALQGPARSRTPPGSATRRAHCRTSSSSASSPASSTSRASAGSSSTSTNASSGSASSTGSPTAGRCTGPPTMEGRVSTFCVSPPDETPAEAATRLGAAGFAVWDGNYYAVEVFKHLGLDDGAIRIGIVHTNMEDEVDRLLAALPKSLVRELEGLLGHPAREEARREAGHRGARVLHRAALGARRAAPGAQGARLLPRTGSGSPGRRRPRRSTRISTSTLSSRPGSPRGSSTTRAARSTPTGRRCASCTGSRIARPDVPHRPYRAPPRRGHARRTARPAVTPRGRARAAAPSARGRGSSTKADVGPTPSSNGAHHSSKLGCSTETVSVDSSSPPIPASRKSSAR